MIDKEELISIIVPVYNVKPFLLHCLETIVSQSYHNLEIILVDDGSTDGSGEICDSFAETDKRCVLIHQENQGLWAARNTGQKIAKGNYIMFVDSDDYLHVDMIKCLYDALVRNPQCGMAMCKYKPTKSLAEDTHAQGNVSCQVLSTEQVIIELGGILVDVVWNKLYRSSLITGLFARNYRIAQDVDYNCRVYLRLDYAVYTNRELYFWMQRQNSATHKNGYRFSYLMTITDIYYRNFVESPKNNVFLNAYFLQRLYWYLLCLKASVWRMDNEINVISKCRNIMKETWYSYLSCRRISFLKRLYVFVLLCVPSGISHWVMLSRRKLKQIM